MASVVPRAVPYDTLSSRGEAAGMTRVERWMLAIAVVEIPLQIDKYLLYRPEVAEIGSIGGINLSLTTLCLVGLYASWWLRLAVGDVLPRRRWHVGWPAAMFCAVSAISVLAAEDTQLVLFELALLIQAYLLYLYAANRIGSRDDLRWVLGALIASGVLQSLLIIASVGAWYLWGIDSIGVGPVELIVSETGRAEGTLKSPTGAGSMLTLLVLIGAPLMGTRGQFWAPLRWAAGGLVLVGLAAIALTQTRAAIATSVLGMGIIAIGMWRRGLLPAYVRWGLVVALLAATIPMGVVLKNRIWKDDRGSAASRIHLTKIALELLDDHGLWGVGAGNAPVALQRYATQSPYRSEWFYTTHCKYLIVWVETGVIGLLLFIAMLGSGIWRGVVLMRRPAAWQIALGLGIVAGLFCHALHMLVDLFTGRPHVEMLWFTLGVVVAAKSLAEQSRPEQTNNEPVD